MPPQLCAAGGCDAGPAEVALGRIEALEDPAGVSLTPSGTKFTRAIERSSLTRTEVRVSGPTRGSLRPASKMDDKAA